jgi:hypothetical protein
MLRAGIGVETRTGTDVCTEGLLGYVNNGSGHFF